MHWCITTLQRTSKQESFLYTYRQIGSFAPRLFSEPKIQSNTSIQPNILNTAVFELGISGYIIANELIYSTNITRYLSEACNYVVMKNRQAVETIYIFRIVLN